MRRTPRVLESYSPERRIREIRTFAQARAHAGRHALRYRVAVIAPNVLDAVHHAGGWLCDRAMAGWEVTVLVVAPGDPRPLHILGAMVLDLEESLSSLPSPSSARPHEIAVSGTVFESDSRICEGISADIRGGSCRITMWGGRFAGGPDEHTSRAQYKPSALARVFKAQAMAAAGGPANPIDAVEIFYRAGVRDDLFDDLLPAGPEPSA